MARILFRFIIARSCKTSAAIRIYERVHERLDPTCRYTRVQRGNVDYDDIAIHYAFQNDLS